MTKLECLAIKLKQDFPPWQFYVCKGLFEKYIAVDIHGKIAFTIWLDRNSDHKELLDEVNFRKRHWLKRRLKTRLFHWSKYRN